MTTAEGYHLRRQAHSKLPIARPEASIDHRRYSLRDAFNSLSIFPPGGDTTYTRPAFKAAAQVNALIDLGIECQQERQENRPVSYTYLAQLLAMHAVNYAMIFKEKEPNFPREFSLTDESDWINFYHQVLEDHGDLLKEIVVYKDIQTTRKNRAIGIPLVLNNLQEIHGHKSLVGVDLGCSMNVIGNHLLSGEGYSVDHEGDKSFAQGYDEGIISAAATQPVDIQHITGVDRSNPLYDEASFRWLLANRHFDEVTPEAIARTEQDLSVYKDGHPNVSYQEQDIFDESSLPHDVDFVLAFTMFSQMPESVVDAGIDLGKRLLNERGVLIIQDYARKTEGLTFYPNREFYSYNMFITGPGLGERYADDFLHIASFRDTRCERIRSGGDLGRFIAMTQG